MPKGMPTLADRLRAAGYGTSYVGKWHLDPDDPRGWQRMVRDMDLRTAPAGHEVMAGSTAPQEGVAAYDVDDHIDGRIAKAAKQELMRLNRVDQPFALMVSFFGPHAPYFIPSDWHDCFDPEALPLPNTFDAPFTGKPCIQSRFRCREWGSQWDELKWRKIRAAYFGYCAMIDALIGGLLDHVDPAETAVLFVADHGEMNGHHRMIYKGPMMYEPLVRVPALLGWPGGPAGRSDERLIDLTDLSATLLSLAGAARDGVEGHDLSDDAWQGRPHVVSEFHEANWVKPVCRSRLAMLRDRRWKYVYNEQDVDELYDLASDPGEVINRVSDPICKERVVLMKRELAGLAPWIDEASAL